jgi:hypothetical protein
LITPVIIWPTKNGQIGPNWEAEWEENEVKKSTGELEEEEGGRMY